VDAAIIGTPRPGGKRPAQQPERFIPLGSSCSAKVSPLQHLAMTRGPCSAIPLMWASARMLDLAA
jgi:hypothetical protein